MFRIFFLNKFTIIYLELVFVVSFKSRRMQFNCFRNEMLAKHQIFCCLHCYLDRLSKYDLIVKVSSLNLSSFYGLWPHPQLHTCFYGSLFFVTSFPRISYYAFYIWYLSTLYCCQESQFKIDFGNGKRKHWNRRVASNISINMLLY